MHTRTASVLGVLAALLASGSAQASDSYRITAGGDQNWGPTSGAIDQTDSAQLDATGTMTGDGNAVGNVDYHLQAGPGIARASLDGDVTVPSNLAYPFNPSLQAVATTELTIDGPAFETNASLNLHVDGVIERPVCGAGTACGALNVHIFAPGGTTAGAVSEFDTLGTTRANDLGLAFDPVEGGYHVHGDVTSREFGLRTGTPIPITIVLNISGRFGGNSAQSTFAAGFDDPPGRLQVSFAPTGPVLNVPAGYTVSGAGVVNNRWDDPFAGDLVVADCDDPSLAQVTTIRGSLVLRHLPDCPRLTLPQLTHIGGDLIVEDNGGGGDLDLGGVSIGGAIDVSGTGGDLTVDTGSVGGAIDVSGTGGDLTIDPESVGGDLDITDNPDAGVIDVGDGQVGGDLTITDNGTAVVDANDSLTVSGDADVETDGGGMLDLSGVEAGGDETVAADGAEAVTAVTAGGTTDVTIGGGTAAMHVVLPDGAFDRPVAFTITRRGDDPAEAAVDPIAGYAFDFAVPALDADARLAFTIDLAALDAATRAALLGGIASGSATIVSKADDPGSAYGAFPRCTGAQTPAADGCVAVTLLAADGSVAASGTETAFARFDGIAGHFSTWAVALIAAPHRTPPPAGTPNPPGGSTPSGPTAAEIRTSLRRQITPHGRAARIRALLKHGYRLRFRALIAGTVNVRWYRPRKSRMPLLVASGRRAFAHAGRATVTMRLTRAGRGQLRRARHLRLRARGTFTPAPAVSVTATRRFTLGP